MITPPVLPLKEASCLDGIKYKHTCFVHLVYEYNGDTLSEVVFRNSDKIHTMRGTSKVVPAPLLSELDIPQARIITLENGFGIEGTDNFYSSEVLARHYALMREDTSRINDEQFANLTLEDAKTMIDDLKEDL